LRPFVKTQKSKLKITAGVALAIFAVAIFIWRTHTSPPKAQKSATPAATKPIEAVKKTTEGAEEPEQALEKAAAQLKTTLGTEASRNLLTDLQNGFARQNREVAVKSIRKFLDSGADV